MPDKETESPEEPSSGWLERFRRKHVYPDVPPPTRFVRGLDVPPDYEPDVAREILEEAQELFKVPVEHGAAAERRATTLQGAVAIAATFTLAAGTLVADTSKIPSDVWRLIFAGGVAAVVVAFVGTGIVALEATSRISRWRDPNKEEGFAERAGLKLPAAQMARASELLVAYGENEALAAWKIERTSRAASWFRIALLLLVCLAFLFVAYAVDATFFG